jgi:hypothetical protein
MLSDEDLELMMHVYMTFERTWNPDLELEHVEGWFDSISPSELPAAAYVERHN